MQFHVQQADWGDTRLNDIETLLKDTASHLDRLLRTPFQGTICVVPSPPGEPPRALYRASPDNPFDIQLTARDRRWNQFAYQFLHEFCHVLSGFENLKDNPNNWFHEAICELASVFTLGRMAERWQTNPPCSNWAYYAQSLRDYSEERLSRQEVQLPRGVTLQTWLSSQEESLRKDVCQREKNDLVAYALLPIFEIAPEGWNAIQNFPTSSGHLADYLLDWHSSVDPEDKDFVARVSNTFDFTIST